jgi:hypothetical protein
MILAKPVVDKQYWILKQDDRKVGNIQAVGDGYQITIDNKTASYKTIPMLCRRENIEIEKIQNAKPEPANMVYGFEVTGKVYNPLWDVKHKLPLFTRDNKSKSWFAAGWYTVKQHRNWKTVQNPKLITLQRYAYQGPFHTKEEANDKSVS